MKTKGTTIALEQIQHQEFIQIGKPGTWKGHYKGEFTLAAKDFEQMISNAAKRGLDIVVDYEHQTLFGDAKAPAGGWIKPSNMKIQEDNLLVLIDWTQAAQQHIQSKEYKYLSPVFMQNTIDPKSGDALGWTLHSVALTNTPFLNEIGTLFDNKTKESHAKDKALEELQTQLEAFQAKEIDDLVEAAIQSKKLTPEQKDWALNYAQKDKEGFQAFTKTLLPLNLKEERYSQQHTPTKAVPIQLTKV